MEKKQKKKNRNEMTCQISAAASTAAEVADNKNETAAVDSLDANKDRDIRLPL